MWFLVAGWAYAFVSELTGAPSDLGYVLAVATAGFVGADPLHRFWPVSPLTATVIERNQPNLTPVRQGGL